SFKFFDNTKTGHIMTRITTELFEIGELAHHGPEDLFIALMTFIGAFAIMMTVNMQLALIILAIVPILIILFTYSNIRMSENWYNMYRDVADVNARIEDAVSGARVVQSFTNENHEMEQFNTNNYSFRRSKLKAYRVMATVHSSIYAMMRFVTLGVLILGAYFVHNGKMTIGELFAFILFVNILFKPIEKISALLEMYPKGMAGFKRFQELLSTEPEIKDRKDAVEVKELRGDISFNHVSFKYEHEL